MKTVIIGLLGSVLDEGKGEKRWHRWRPTVSLVRQENLTVDRLELIHHTRFETLAYRVIRDLGKVAPDTQVVRHAVDVADPWDFEEVYATLHDFARGYSFDPDKEDYLVHITTGTHVEQICLFLLTESRHFPGRLIQTAPPARDDPDRSGHHAIIDLDLSKYDRIAMRFRKEARDDISFLKSGIETRNRAFNSLIERIEQVAVNSIHPLLLMGPTGAGKSQLARRIYELKKAKRKLAGAFVEVNCATLRGDAAMSALFGHEKGAFTGALRKREGLLRAADGGVLFLDEIGELGLDEQAVLLRAMEEKRFLPMGSDVESMSDFQLICGTNHDLHDDVAQGRFREDLFTRINLWTFRLPGLRERPEDIAPNLRYELDRFAERDGTLVTFNRQAMRRFLDFATSPEAAWTANFRDLNAAITRMATLAPGGRVTPAVVDEEIRRLRNSWRGAGPDADRALLESVMDAERVSALDLFDRVQLAEVVRVCRRCRTLSDAGRTLFAISRQSKKQVNDADRLRKYLARFDLDWQGVQGDEGRGTASGQMPVAGIR